MERDNQEKQTLKRLRDLEKVVPEIGGTVAQYYKHNCLTPKQGSFIIHIATKNKIDLFPFYPAITLKKKVDKDALLEMEEWKVKQVWVCLTPPQRKFYIEHNFALYETGK